MFEALLDSAASAAALETSPSKAASSKPASEPSSSRWLGAPTLTHPNPNPNPITLIRRAFVLVSVVRDLAHCGRHGQGLPRAQGPGAGHPQATLLAPNRLLEPRVT